MPSASFFIGRDKINLNILSIIDAKEQKLPRYFTGRPCKNGHTVERFACNRSCVECDRLRKEEHKSFTSVYNKEYYSNNKAKYQRYYEDNSGEYKTNAKNYRIRHPGRINAYCANRRAIKLLATPTWSETDQIKVLFVEAQIISNSTGVSHHVDHIIPLTSDRVCGLHVIANLQIITATENLKKKSKFK